MMARSTKAPCKGRIQMRKTNPLHLFTFGLQRTAGPYKWVKPGLPPWGAARPLPPNADIGPGGQSVGQAAQFCLASIDESRRTHPAQKMALAGMLLDHACDRDRGIYVPLTSHPSLKAKLT